MTDVDAVLRISPHRTRFEPIVAYDWLTGNISVRFFSRVRIAFEIDDQQGQDFFEGIKIWKSQDEEPAEYSTYGSLAERFSVYNEKDENTLVTKFILEVDFENCPLHENWHYSIATRNKGRTYIRPDPKIYNDGDSPIYQIWLRELLRAPIVILRRILRI